MKRNRGISGVVIVVAVAVTVPTTSACGSLPTRSSDVPATTAGGPLRVFVEPADDDHSIRSLITDARRTVDLTMYELDDRPIEDQLVLAHRRGVRVRVVLDRAYHGAEVNRAAFERLTAAGVAVRWGPDRRIVHQKTLTIDGEVSAVMTDNLTASDQPTTRDFVVVDRNPAAVSAIEAVFADDWAGGAGETGPARAGLVWSPGATPALVRLIDSAARSLTVENEEMDAPVLESALEAASSRGVHVEVVMTADRRGDVAVRGLARAGVRVATASDSGGALYLHAKAIVADHRTAFVGSQNFSVSSLDDNRELGIITADPSVVDAVATTLATDFAAASAGDSSEHLEDGVGGAHTEAGAGLHVERGHHAVVDDHGVPL